MEALPSIPGSFLEAFFALATLENLQYSSETFSSAEKLATSLRQIISPFSVQTFSPIFMDSPVNGHCKGQLLVIDLFKIPRSSDEHAPKYKTRYVVGLFGYFGNGVNEMLNGCCGAVVWNEDKDVLGQFRFQATDAAAWCYLPSFEPLIKMGYKVWDD